MAKASDSKRKAGPAGKRTEGRKQAGTSVEGNLREDVIATALAMSRAGLSPGRSGNVSVRVEDGMLITPSGMPYETLTPADIVHVQFDGTVAAGQRKPSSEWQFHLSALARRPDRKAVVHCHSLHAVVLACRHEPIPAFHYMVAIAGGTDIPCVPYATFGSDKLARYVADGLAERDACLMANHGQIAIGASLASALELAHEVELLSEQYAKVLMLGKPKPLSQKEMAVVLERFAGYGQHAQKPDTPEQ